MASAMKVAGVRALEVASITSRSEVSSVIRGGNLRFNVGRPAAVVLRSSPARSVVVVRAGEGVGEKVKKAAGAAKGRLEQAGDYLSGKADEAEGSAKDARGEIENLGSKADSAFEDAGGSVKTTSSELRKDVGKDLKDVNRAAEFYNKAFGLEIRSQNKSNSWIEMETGATTLAFTPVKQNDTQLTGGVSSSDNNNIVINLDFQDVEAAYQHAIAQGATSVAHPEDENWPQKVGYVKDIDGNIVRLGSFPAM